MPVTPSYRGPHRPCAANPPRSAAPHPIPLPHSAAFLVALQHLRPHFPLRPGLPRCGSCPDAEAARRGGFPAAVASPAANESGEAFEKKTAGSPGRLPAGPATIAGVIGSFLARVERQTSRKQTVGRGRPWGLAALARRDRTMCRLDTNCFGTRVSTLGPQFAASAVAPSPSEVFPLGASSTSSPWPIQCCRDAYAWH